MAILWRQSAVQMAARAYLCQKTASLPKENYFLKCKKGKQTGFNKNWGRSGRLSCHFFLLLIRWNFIIFWSSNLSSNHPHYIDICPNNHINNFFLVEKNAFKTLSVRFLTHKVFLKFRIKFALGIRVEIFQTKLIQKLESRQRNLKITRLKLAFIFLTVYLFWRKKRV